MITIETRGNRAYALGDTYSIRDRLKALGAHWDADARAWWVGSAKAGALESLVARPSNGNASDRADHIDESDRVIRGRARYKGKLYYLLYEGQRRDGSGPCYKLAMSDGKVFWAAQSEPVELVKHYREPTSIRRLREYADRMKREAAGGECECRCHKRDDCRCAVSGYCPVHHDGCDYCGCEH